MLGGKQMNPQVLLSPDLLAFVQFSCGIEVSCVISRLVLDLQVLPFSLGPEAHCAFCLDFSGVISSCTL